MFFRIKLRDGFPDCAKAVLQEVAFNSQLTNGFQHLVPFLCCSSLLSLYFPLRLSVLLKYAGRVFHKLSFPVAHHVGIQVVLRSNGSQLPLSLEYLQNDLGLKFRRVFPS